MAYNDVPLANQRISDSQDPIRQNFLNIQTAFSVNHIPITTPGEGKHTFLELIALGAPPAIIAGEVGLFNNIPMAPFPLTGVSEMFIQNSATNITPITAKDSSAGLTGNGWTYLPSGLLIKWGSFTAVGDPFTTEFTFIFPSGATIAAFQTALLNVQLTKIVGGASVENPLIFFQPVGSDKTQIVVASTTSTGTAAATQKVSYLAIGI